MFAICHAEDVVNNVDTFQKKKLWNIPVDQLEWNVKLLIDVRGEEHVRD